jgi:cell wall-associated NlpC family hydrolase
VRGVCRVSFICFCLFALAGCGGVRTHTTGVHSIQHKIREPNAEKATALAFRALSLVGTPYVYGGELPGSGFDCSGFMKYLYRDALQISIARTAAQQSASGDYVARMGSLRLGDLVFFQENQLIYHVGMYVGEGRMVHAPRTGRNVELSTITGSYWSARFAFGRRLL